MIKKIIIISFFVVFVGITIWFYVESLTTYEISLGNDLPSFNYHDSYGTKSIDASHTGQLVIVIFSIDCPHCNTLLSNLNKNTGRLNNVSLYLLAKEANLFDEIKNNQLNNVSNLLKKDNVFFGFIKSEVAKTKFGARVVPSIYVFDINNKLKKKLKGSVSINEIIN